MGAAAAGDSHSKFYGVTGTLAYELAQNLTLRGEVRWDKVRSSPGDEFFGDVDNAEVAAGTPELEDDQIVGLVQLVYGF